MTNLVKSFSMDNLSIQFTNLVSWSRTASPVTLLGTILLALCIVYLGYAIMDITVKSWRTRHIPSPPSLPLIGHVHYLLNEPWIQFNRFAAKYGSLYKLQVWNKTFVVVSDPALVKEILKEKRLDYPKDDWSYSMMSDVLGHGLVTSEGTRWVDHSKVIGPLFRRSTIPRLHPIFQSAANRFIDAIEKARKTPSSSNNKNHTVPIQGIGNNQIDVDLSGAFRQVTLEVISAVAIGLTPDKAGVFPLLFETILDELNRRVYEPYRALWLPLQILHRQRIAELNKIVSDIIANRRKNRDLLKAEKNSSTTNPTVNDIGEGKGDILDMILENSESLGVPFSISDILDELKTQLLAGHETSSMMLTWTCYLLARHPEKLKVAVEQVDRILGILPGVESSIPDAEVRIDPPNELYSALSYLDLSMKESMRLYSPVPVLARETGHDIAIGKDDENKKPGTWLPAKTAILISIWSMHHNRSLWGDDVEEFRPERFETDPIDCSYIPFSAGVRICVGQHLAMNEAKVVLGTLLRHYSISLKTGQPEPITDKYIIPIRPKDGLHVVLTPRVKL